MNRKIFFGALVVIVTLLFSTTIVYAGMGNNKLTYEARIQLTGFGSSVKKDLPPNGPLKVRFNQLSMPNPPALFVINIGGFDYYPNMDENELLIIRNYVGDFRLIKATETYSFEGVDGTIVVKVTGWTKNYSGEREEFVNVEGHGTGYFEDVIITGKGTDEGGVKVHTGTIMGWPGLP